MSGFENNPVITVQKPPLTPEKGKIIHYYAVNRWDEDKEFDEWTKLPLALSAFFIASNLSKCNKLSIIK